jgi:hypothetical protein
LYSGHGFHRLLEKLIEPRPPTTTRFVECLEGARLQRLLKESGFERFVSGHDFSRADKPFIFFPESAFSRRQKTGAESFSATSSAVPHDPLS